MARTVGTEFQQQIEAVRREAYAAGYSAAMGAVLELASRPARRVTGNSVSPDRIQGRRLHRVSAQEVGPVKENPARRTRMMRARATGRPSRGALRGPRLEFRRAPRGTNARMIEGILKGAAPGALRPAEIRKALQDNGATISYPSISYALGQLAGRNAVERVGDSNVWRYARGIA